MRALDQGSITIKGLVGAGLPLLRNPAGALDRPIRTLTRGPPSGQAAKE